MKLPYSNLTVIDWRDVALAEIPGEMSSALARTHENGDLRLRAVDYGSGYLADHWCDRGHVIYVLEGELELELQDGRSVRLQPGMSVHVSDHGDAAHRVRSEPGAKVFILD